ncbi:hypothetical protein BJV78DRAFT_1302630 [Lactifluus subvellereus]|nr:hypothetical protein BJV78DRAFT_1302630 [Lactifluus subvellereus]
MAKKLAKLDAVVDDIGKAGSGVQTKTFVVDFASADDARWEALLEELKPIEVGVLVNNVGVSHELPTDFVDTLRELVTINNVNIAATLRITSLIAPAMVSRSSPSLPFCCALTPPVWRVFFFQKEGTHPEHGFVRWRRSDPHARRLPGSKAFLRTWSDSLSAELTPKGVVVEHVNTYFVTSSMSKIRRTSFFIPNPKTFVRAVLAKLHPGTVTPYWTHALVGAVMALAPPKAVLAYTHALQKDIRRRALAKQARLAKQE